MSPASFSLKAAAALMATVMLLGDKAFAQLAPNAPDQPDTVQQNEADQAASLATPKWVFCTGASDSTVYASGVFKLGETSTLADVARRWDHYLTQQYQATGDCHISASSKAVAYSSLDAALFGLQRRNHLYQLSHTSWQD